MSDAIEQAQSFLDTYDSMPLDQRQRHGSGLAENATRILRKLLDVQPEPAPDLPRLDTIAGEVCIVAAQALFPGETQTMINAYVNEMLGPVLAVLASVKPEKLAPPDSARLEAIALETANQVFGLLGFGQPERHERTVLSDIILAALARVQELDEPGPDGLKQSIDYLRTITSLCGGKTGEHLDRLEHFWRIYTSAHRKHQRGPELVRRVNELEAALARVQPEPSTNIGADWDRARDARQDVVAEIPLASLKADEDHA